MDPLSITAGTVGILSLGITTCQGLVGYYGLWEDCPDEVKDLCLYLERVSQIMRNLRVCIHNHTFSEESIGQVTASIQACESHLGRLEEKFKMFDDINSPGDSGVFKSMVQRALFPFRAKTLKQIKDSITCLEATLGLAVGTLGMYTL